MDVEGHALLQNNNNNNNNNNSMDLGGPLQN